MRKNGQSVCGSDVFDALSELQDVAEELATESDGLCDLIEAVEVQLAELGMGVEASVVVKQEGTTWIVDADEDRAIEAPAQHVHELFYGPSTPGWGLHVRSFTAVDGRVVSVAEPRHLSGVGRDLRIDAAAMIPDLVEVLEKEAHAKIERLRDAKRRLGVE